MDTKIRTGCLGEVRGIERDPDQDFLTLATKFNQLADVVRRYISEAPMDRAVRNANATQMAKVLERIVGGVQTQEGAYPDCCLVGALRPNGFRHWFCSGVLVGPSLVLTAGHCINPGASDPYVVALNATNYTSLGNAEFLQAKKAVVHPNYLSMRTNDIAALVLSSSAQTAPTPMAESSEVHTASEVTLAGFGNNDYASTRGFGVQRKVDVDITAIRRSPDDDLDEAEAKFGFESDYEFVAGGEGYDSCNGDSGGPAYVMVGGRRKVAGLTSRGSSVGTRPCGDGGIYTRPDAHLHFLREVSQRYGIDL